MFITFEGVDGCGKTTQSQLLAEYLIKNGYEVILTREPGGGSKFSMDIRNLLSNSDSLLLSELLAIYAARNEHLEKLIKPALKENKIVICDRFIDSSIVYFGYKEVENEEIFLQKVKIIEALNSVIDIKMPDLTILIDTDLETIKKRILLRKHKDKYDEMSSEHMNNIINLYRMIANKNEKRILKINGSETINEISENIKNKTMKFIKENGFLDFTKVNY